MKNECLLCFFPPLLLMHFKWKRVPVLLLLSTACFIKETITNLNLLKLRSDNASLAVNFIPAPWFLCMNIPIYCGTLLAGNQIFVN